jgi:hypothetical protein
VRSLLGLLLVGALALVACGDDDDDSQAQGVTTTTAPTTSSSSTTSTSADDDACAGANPVPPAGEVVAEAGDLVLIAEAAGSSADVVAVHGLVDCAYEQLLLGGQPAVLAYGGSVTHADGIRCDPDRLVVLSATSDDGTTYQASAVTYEVDGDELVEVDRETATIDASTQAEQLDPYYRLDC